MKYEVKSLRGKEDLTVLLLDAVDSGEAEAKARAEGYTVISVTEKKGLAAWGRRHGFPLALFSQELTALLDAGLSLVEALETLAEKEEAIEVKKTLKQIISHLYEGRPFSYALEQLPRDFPPLYVATIRSAEKSGAISEVLSRYVVYQEQMEGIKRKVVSSSIYPVILAVVGMLVMLFLMLYVVPRFSMIYADLGQNLPFMSRLLMNWGIFLGKNQKMVLMALIILPASIFYAATRPACQVWAQMQLWRLPAIGREFRLYQLARFYRSMGMLLAGGMPVVQALHLVSGLLQASMREQLSLATTRIREGGAISQAMEKCELVTPVALRLLRVGERTGRMGEMMERIAVFYEDETARRVEHFIKLFEPLLMSFVGIAIGVIVVLMYFPIFELAGSIQ